MRFLIICSVCILFIVFISNANALDTDYRSYDAVVIEAALDDEAEAESTTLSSQASQDNPPESAGAQARKNPDNYCVTSNGLSGTCKPVKECFARLFPVEDGPAHDDTPHHTGVYNQELVKLLIESYGFCGNSYSLRDAQNLGFRGPEEICCATMNSTVMYPLDEPSNDTSAIDPEFTKKPCGYLKIDSKVLPDVEKIVGGRLAVLGEFPYMVAMLRRGNQFCGASLIDNRNVLTAAHCVEFMNSGDVKALTLHIGDLDILSTKEAKHVVRKAKRVLYHKGFSMRNLEHDIAIIHLDKPVEFSDTVQPVCLHPGNPPYDNGKEVADVSGWGTTSSGGSQSSKLRTVRLNVITQDQCNQEYAKASKKITAGMVCAGAPGKDSCQGDSGGPLVLDNRGQAKQIGIVSWGIGCASYPGVYTRVDKYMKWISKNKS